MRIQIRGCLNQKFNLFAGIPNQEITRSAQKIPHLSRRMIVVHA